LFGSTKTQRNKDALLIKNYNEDQKRKRCDYSGCQEIGEYKAPKSRMQLRDYHFFCLEHVRAYNKAWNYHEGLNDQQVENSIRRSTTWERPSWPFGARRQGFDSFVRGDIKDTFNFFAEGNNIDDKEVVKGKFDPQQIAALDIMGLKPPLDIGKLKSQYKYLVKIHHPDRNGGDKEAEERLKLINEAYTTLKQFLS